MNKNIPVHIITWDSFEYDRYTTSEEIKEQKEAKNFRIDEIYGITFDFSGVLENKRVGD
jgi:hypothetical protein